MPPPPAGPSVRPPIAASPEQAQGRPTWVVRRTINGPAAAGTAAADTARAA